MMIHPDIQAMLVRERSATLLAAAAASRRGRQARAAAASRTAASRASCLLRNSGASLVHRGSGIVEYETDLACAEAQA